MESTEDTEMNSVEMLDIKQISGLMQKAMKKDDSWFLLDKKWFEMCKLFLNDNDPTHNPGPVDNSALFKSSSPGTKELRERLQEDLDYVFVPEEGWNLLVNHFGILNEGHEIKRLVIEQGHFSSYCIVEVYPMELKLCIYGGSSKEEIYSRPFSRVTTLSELDNEMRRLFNIDTNRDTQLWVSGSILNPHDESGSSGNLSGASRYHDVAAASTSSKNNDTQMLHEVGLNSGAVVTLEVRNQDGTWPSSRPRHGAVATRSSKCQPGLCGLMNLGNTCFMNSALQCMSNTPPLTEYFTSERYVKELNTDNPLGMGGEIAKTYAELVKSQWSGAYTCLAPREFKVAVGRFAPQFSGFQQQDCQELMAFLLDGLHEDLNRVKQKPYIEIKTEVDKRPDEVVAAESWSNYRKRNDSIIVDTFHSLLKSTLVCPECQLVSVTFDPSCYLSLPLPVKRERAIDVLFVAAGYHTKVKEDNQHAKQPIKAIQINRLMIPKYGIISDICNAVAKAINDSKELQNHVVEPEKLIVADIYSYRFHKLYSNDDGYAAQLDDIAVYETLDDHIPIPVYLREIKSEDNPVLFGRPFFINVPDTNYETIYEAVSSQLKYCMKLPPKSENSESDSDEGVAECERSEGFSLTVVNPYGSSEVEKLERNKPFKLNNKCYLAADFTTKMKSKCYSDNDSEYILKLTAHKNTNSGNKSAIGLSECINQFTTTERLGADDVWYCPRCKKHQQATKKFDMWSLPKVLIIHLKRFSYSRFWRDKLDTLVEFPVTNLNMGEYVLNGENKDSLLYDLIAVANHYGGLGGGHYTAYAKNRDTGNWHYFDDSHVSEATEDNVVSKNAYVLFYLRKE